MKQRKFTHLNFTFSISKATLPVKAAMLFLLLLSLNKSFAISNVFTTAQSGSFDDASTWLGGKVPSYGSVAVIVDSVDLSSSSADLAFVVLQDGGSLTVGAEGTLNTNGLTIDGGSVSNTAGIINIGKTGGDNKTLTLLSGVFTISGGRVTVNGNIVMTDGEFSMSGGRLNIDPNSGDEAGSVESGVDIFSLSSDVSGSVHGGIITFVDPPYDGDGKTLVYTGDSHNSSWSRNLMVFGGLDGADISTSVYGFNIDTRASGVSGSYLVLGNVIVSGGKSKAGSIANRYLSGAVSSSHGFDIGGNLTIKDNSEVRTLSKGAVLRIRGNINNGGTFVDMAGISFSQRSGPNSFEQFVSNNNNTGIFKNSVSRPTANFTNLEFNNVASPIAVTFALGDGQDVEGSIFVSGNVAFTNGIVDIGTDNHLIFGIAATATHDNGALLRGTGPGGGAQMVKQFPTGASTFTYYIADNIDTYDYSPVTVEFSNNDYYGRAVSINVFDTVHYRMNSGGSPSDYLTRYWRIIGTPIGTFDAVITFNYLPEDVVGDESKLQFYKWGGLGWSKKKAVVGDNSLVIKADETTLADGIIAEITGRYVPPKEEKTLDNTIASSENVVSLYPNPVKGGNLNVQLSHAVEGKYDITLYNQAGQQVYHRSASLGAGLIKESVQLPKNLPSGIYTFLLRDKQGKVNQQKLVIKN